MRPLTFVPEETIRQEVEQAYRLHRACLEKLLVDVEVHHVGSTAVPGSLTKGDLDIQVRLTPERFEEAVAILGQHYQRNMGSTRTMTFASFKDDSARPPLGIQLCAAGGPEDFFCRLRDFFLDHPNANRKYNDLKTRFQGGDMDEYRKEKSAFLEGLLQQLT